MGKDNKEKDFAVIAPFSDLDVKMRLQKVYSKYEGKISTKMAIRGFYASNGASAEEVTTGENAGVQLTKDQAYADRITYENVTPEEVEAWLEAKKAGEDSPTVSNTPKASAGTPKAGLFN